MVVKSGVFPAPASSASQKGVVVDRLGARVEDRTERVGIPGPGPGPQLRGWIVHIHQLARPALGFP